MLARRCGAGAHREVCLLSINTLDIEIFYTRRRFGRISPPLNVAKAGDTDQFVRLDVPMSVHWVRQPRKSGPVKRRRELIGG
jgi:hypothetical protein